MNFILDFIARKVIHCRHKHTDSVRGWTWCNDCGGDLPDCLFPKSESNPGGYTLTWPTNKYEFEREREAACVDHWKKYGPCAPQCYAECDGGCAQVHRDYGRMTERY